MFQTICSRLIQFWAKKFFFPVSVQGAPVSVQGALVSVQGAPVSVQGAPVSVQGALGQLGGGKFFFSKWFSDFGTVIEMCFRQFAVDWYPFEQNRNFENFEKFLQVPTTQFLRRKFFFFSKWFSDFGTKIEMCFRQFAVDWYHFEPNQNFENFEIFF